MAHTHGPWHIEGSFDDEVGVSIVGPDDTLICEVEPFTEQWTNEEIANAHLLAAAPELLEALKRILPAAYNSKASNFSNVHGAEDTKQDMIAAALAAIAKAEGK